MDAISHANYQQSTLGMHRNLTSFQWKQTVWTGHCVCGTDAVSFLTLQTAIRNGDDQYQGKALVLVTETELTFSGEINQK